METNLPGFVDGVKGTPYTAKKHRWRLLLLSGATVPLILYASNHGEPSSINSATGMYEFVAGTVINPSEVNDNFSHLATLVNTPDYVSAITVTEDGKVGVGVKVPTAQLDVYAPPAGPSIGDTSLLASFGQLESNAEWLRLLNFRTGEGGTAHGTLEQRIQRRVDVSDMGYLGFGSNYLSLAGNGVENARINSEGSFGIGTSEPAYRLDVQTRGDGSGETVARFQDIHVENSAGPLALGISSSNHYAPNPGMIISTLTNNPLHFGTNGRNSQVTLLTNGNLGIGTPIPLTALHVHERGIQIGVSSDPDDNFHIASDVVEGEVDRALRLYNGNYGTGTQLASFAPDGKVGLRELNPDVHLDVLGGDELPPLKNAIVRLRASDVGGSDASLVLGVGSGNAPYISDGDSATSLGLFLITNGQNRVFINRAGNVGIGAADPKGTLDVNGSIYQRGNKLYADYVFQPDYQLESIEAHAEFMWREKHLAAVPAAQYDENGLEVLEVGAHRMGMLEELEKAHVYIEQLNDRCKMLDEQVAKQQNALTVQQRELEDTKVRLARLEALLFSKK